MSLLFAQVPANDLIENATLVSAPSFFSDNYVRLDLATASAGGQSGCDIGGWEVVYYKFTAASTGDINITVQQGSFHAITDAFVIVYSAPNLNTVDEADLTLVSICNFGTSATINASAGISYYALIYRADLSALTHVLIDFGIPPGPVPQLEKDALAAIYTAMSGDTWNSNTNWNTSNPVSDWSGITTAIIDGVEHVTELLISGNMTGTIPTEIGDILELRILDLNTQDWVEGYLTGSIPPEIGNLTKLTYLGLFNHDLSGEVPSEIWTMSSLESIIIGDQRSGLFTLTNGIPPEISNLQNLIHLNLNFVPLSLPLQPELFNLPNLLRLRLVECGLSGTLPFEFAGISDVIVGSNNFEGPIPQEIINSMGNSRLSITYNYFDFTDLEPLVTANNYTTLIYSPQRTKDEVLNLEFPPGEDITLSVNDTGVNRSAPNKNLVSLEENQYQWFKDGVAIDGAVENTYTILNAQEADSGIYYVEISNSLLSDLIIRRPNINVLVDAGLFTNEYEKDKVKIYPNPTKSEIFIVTNEKINEARIFNVLGEQVLMVHKIGKKIDVSRLSNGMYFLKITTEVSEITKKLIVNRK